MAYLGRSPVRGEVVLLDSIESQFNGSLSSFTLQRNGVDFFPAQSEQLLVSLNNVIQRPNSTASNGFVLSGSSITFNSAPASNIPCYIISFGHVLDVAGGFATGSIAPDKLSVGGPYWDVNGNLTINTDFTIGSESVNTTGTNAATLISFSATTYRTVECTVQVTKGTVYHSTKLLIVHDGTDTYMTEYSTISTGSSLATFSADISSGNIIVTATPTDTTARTIKIQYSLLKT
jgi:hypothetical protein